ncbi:MAG: hypothetical protein JM58_09410 [Peptococcaceae bacterium BICA1-8]|nr:MAG: hypothetical protein JM58_09410 [Peptococcaceae bacterium BICA1-8]
MKICQKQLSKTVKIEDDPFIGICKVYECKVLKMNFPALFDVTLESLIKDICHRCEKENWEKRGY